MLEDKEVREVYCETLMELAEKDERIVLLEADLMMASGTGRFKAKFPDRTINVGVCEANMIGIAAGLSAYGKIPIANTFTAFASRRAFDQTAVSVAYAKLNVKIGGTDPGITAQLNGGTHMSFEDVGIMRTIPTMTIFEPVDSVQLKKALPQIMEHYGPVYMRIFRRKAEKVFNDDYVFKLGKADTLLEGKDAVVFATGIMVKNTLDAAEILKKEGINIKVINIHTIKPLDEEAVIAAAKECGVVVTAENHNIINGLGSAVAEVLAENYPVPMKRVGVRDEFGEVGMADYLTKRFGLGAENIAEAVREVLKKK